ncbi:hypothetical protein [Natrinema sp. 1APR25-10V2]|uniref:hypothetical protein n=1 Tax=Natrinema sp. 1APR25-10V2 TaxID=2951081 RepID=UPI002874F6C1|nr:hypothetical protein [Natrinema sp. 1APR25-10V2]MDS0477335.1 hypothetical protein [Natrinema sp. 1APR25-10V2]
MIEASPFAEYLGIEVVRAEVGYGEAVLELEDEHAGPPNGHTLGGEAPIQLLRFRMDSPRNTISPMLSFSSMTLAT